MTTHQERIAQQINIGDCEYIYDIHEQKFIKVWVTSVTQNHVVVRREDKRLWSMVRTEFLRMRTNGREERGKLNSEKKA